ncbi:MAG: restriction endonuclease [Muribaculaceae bacterium]|nr:restriction endonuclease [Muribaculaceae bacterium]
MVEIGIQKKANGLIYTIKKIEENALIKCYPNCVWRGGDCSRKQFISRDQSNKFKCILVTINVKNIGGKVDWYVGEEDVILVDNEGFTYQGKILCDGLLPQRTAKDRQQILKNTQVDYIQMFPLLPEGVKLSSAIVDIGGEKTTFSLSDGINDIKKIAIDELQEETKYSSDFNSCNNSHENWKLNRIKYRAQELEVLIFERLNNVLTSNEMTKLENKINKEKFSLSLEIDKNGFSSLPIKKDVDSIYQNYFLKLQTQKEQEKGRKGLSQKIDELLELTPREFEEYCTELLVHCGYASVELTPYVNDKGIDIIAYKDGYKFGIQCKRYKGNVGSPDIQKFLGALSHINADKGLFITTGMFSFEAEKMAKQHPIILINRIDLAKMILEALNSLNIESNI